MSRNDTSSPTDFKSRFSLAALLPARHAPLKISHPHQQTLAVSDLPIRSLAQQHLYPLSHPSPLTTNSNQRIISQYASPLTSYPETPEPTTPPRGRRPPPIDLSRIRAAYPTEQAVNGINEEIDFGTPSTPSPISPYSNYGRMAEIASPPILPPLPVALNKKAEKDRVKREKDEVKAEKRRRDALDQEDPFEVAIVESDHRYDSWKGGKVDIRPGEVIPRNLVGTYTGHNDSRGLGGGGKRGTIRGENPDETIAEEVYDSVLQHVLLTPTYLRSSPSSTHHTISGRRETMLDRAKRMSRFIPLLPSAMRREEPAAKAVRDLRDREGREMDRFRRVQGVQLNSESSLALGSPGCVGEKEKASRSYEKYDIKDLGDVKGGALRKYQKRERRRNCWGWGSRKRSKEEMESLSMGRRLYIKCRFLFLILLLVIAAIVLAAVFLTRNPTSAADNHASSNSTSPSTTVSSSISQSGSIAPTGSASASGTISNSAPTPSSTSRTLQTCLDNFSSTSTSSYPCSDCTPLLLSTTNDFTAPLVNGNSTGVGAALQYCTMMDILRAGNKSAFEASGWTGKGTCAWSGVKCDPRGRVSELTLTYPNVPYKFPSTLGQIPSLTVLRIKGNSTIPSGPFPSSVLSSTLITLDVSDTALQGPIASYDFNRAGALTTIYLSNNPILGSAVPDMRNNLRLLTLAMTGQLLGSVNEAGLPSSLTYLDLSYNSLLDQVPSFSSLIGLKTLYLESNSYSTSPSALPLSLTDLRLNNNPSLRGSMPMATCGNTGLASCDLRNTVLAGSGGTGNGTRSCGRCQFS